MNKVPESILVRAPNWIGDHVMAYPFFHYLRQAYPRARIGVQCAPWVQSIQYKNLVNEVIPLIASPGGLWRKMTALEENAASIRASRPWDLGIILPNSFSSAWIFYRAGVRKRRGYADDSRGLLLHEGIHVPTQTITHRAQAYVDLLPESVRPKAPVSEFWGVRAENELDEDIPGVVPVFDAEKSWPDAEPLDQPKGDYWVLAPGSKATSRRWSLERFRALAKKIATSPGFPHGLKGYVVGGLDESEMADELCRDPSLNLEDLTGQGPVSSLWKIFAGARFTVSNDSGLAHVAALCGSPVQVIWGAGNPKRTLPIGPKKIQIIFNPTDCWPCERNICVFESPDKKLECLNGIQADAVFKEIQSGIRP